MVCCLALSCLFAFTACSDEKDVTGTASDFMDQCADGDYEDAARLCTGNAASELKLDKLENTLQKQFTSGLILGTKQNISDYSEETQNCIEDFLKYCMKEYIKSYKLNDDYNDDQKTISASVRVLDPDSANTDDAQKKIESLTEKYTSENKEKLLKTYQSGGESAVIQKAITDLCPQYMKILKSDYIDKMKTKKETWKFTFTKKDGNWLIKKADGMDLTGAAA